MERHPRAGQTDIHICQTKTWDMTRHGIRDIDISSLSGGPRLPRPDRNWERATHQSLPLSTSSQSINDSDELRVSTTVTSSTTATRGHLGRDPLLTARPHISCHMRRDPEPCDPIFHPIPSRISPQSMQWVNTFRVAGLQLELFARFLDPAVRPQAPRHVRPACGPR